MSNQILKRELSRARIENVCTLTSPACKALPGILLSLILGLTAAQHGLAAQKRRPPGGGQSAVVVDERLAALLDAPNLSARLLQRMKRGRLVAIVAVKRGWDGVWFYRVAVTSRTRGWVQSEALVSASRRGDDERLLNLIRTSKEFDRLARARIFLDYFPRSSLRPQALLMLGEAAEEAAQKMTREAGRRLDEDEMRAGGAPLFSYYLNYNGLDRYRRQEISFLFDRATRAFHYDGRSWREIVRKYPRSPEAETARQRLNALEATMEK